MVTGAAIPPTRPWSTAWSAIQATERIRSTTISSWFSRPATLVPSGARSPTPRAKTRSWSATRSTAETRGRHSGRGHQLEPGTCRRWPVLPTIVAPGSRIASTRSSAALGAVFQDSSGVSHGDHTEMSGTSMAAAHVSGVCALLIQWWQNHGGTLPSPALLKALLINGAEDLAGGPDGRATGTRQLAHIPQRPRVGDGSACATSFAIFPRPSGVRASTTTRMRVWPSPPSGQERLFESGPPGRGAAAGHPGVDRSAGGGQRQPGAGQRPRPRSDLNRRPARAADLIKERFRWRLFGAGFARVRQSEQRRMRLLSKRRCRSELRGSGDRQHLVAKCAAAFQR